MRRIFSSFDHALSVALETGVSPIEARQFVCMARAFGLIDWHEGVKYGAGTGDLSEPQCGEFP